MFRTRRCTMIAKPSAVPLAILLLSCASTPAATDPAEKDFIYKTTPRELALVVTFPPDAKLGDKRPAVVFFSGGAWANSNVNQFKEYATYFAERGAVVVRVDYRVSKKHDVGPDKCV